MIMDDQEYNMNDMNDDLFGDTDQIAMPTLNAPQTKDLPRRLDELSASGCCQRIAWSTNGCVAYITPDRYSVKLRVFARDPETGAWDLGKESTLELPAGHESFQIAHLSCSHLGNDMAVVDDAGHVLIFSCHMAVDRVSYSRTEAVQPEAEMDAVVGMHWLAIHPYEAKVSAQLICNAESYRLRITYHGQLPAAMPHGHSKRAVISFTMPIILAMGRRR